MALRATVVFLGLHLVDTDLLALSGLDDLAGHGGAFHNGGAEHVDALIDNGQNLIKGDGLAIGNVELLDVDNVSATRYCLPPVMITACFILHPAFLADSLSRAEVTPT